MPKKTKIIFLILIPIALVFVFAAGIGFWYYQKFNLDSSYYAVYLSTGDVYFGKLNYFPRFSLSDVWLLNRSSDVNNPLSISEFNKAIWGPEDKLYLNEKNILWKVKLRLDSQVVGLIKNNR